MFESKEALEIPIKINNKIESNNFLRALWAEMRNEFGKCAWQFMPIKLSHERTIMFGSADIGLNDTVWVGIHYQRKDCIDKLLFYFDNLTSADTQKLRNCVFMARNALQNQINVHASAEIEITNGPYRFEHVSSNNFAIKELTDGDKRTFTIDIIASGFDTIDATTLAQGRMAKIIDALSALSNLALYQKNLIIDNDRPIRNEFLVISNVRPEDDFESVAKKAVEDGFFG